LQEEEEDDEEEDLKISRSIALILALSCLASSNPFFVSWAELDFSVGSVFWSWVVGGSGRSLWEQDGEDLLHWSWLCRGSDHGDDRFEVS
jgi:hypothetical protein